MDHIAHIHTQTTFLQTLGLFFFFGLKSPDIHAHKMDILQKTDSKKDFQFL